MKETKIGTNIMYLCKIMINLMMNQKFKQKRIANDTTFNCDVFKQ